MFRQRQFSWLSSIERSLFVLGLTHHVVCTLGSLISYVEEGTKARKTASTLQNPSSSRSHALLTVDLSQETTDAERPSSSGTFLSSKRQDATLHGGSRLHLVDLAGSESAATCSGVHRLKVSHFLKIISSAGIFASWISRDENRYSSVSRMDRVPLSISTWPPRRALIDSPNRPSELLAKVTSVKDEDVMLMQI